MDGYTIGGSSDKYVLVGIELSLARLDYATRQRLEV